MPESSRRKHKKMRDDYRCAYRDTHVRDHDITLAHVQPRVSGGDHSDGNLVTCCKACNTLKAGQAAWFFLASDELRRKNFLKNAKAVWPRIKRAIEEEARKTK